MTTTAHRRIRLTPEEMTTLDDGQGWYEPGDSCWLGGHVDGGDAAGDALVRSTGLDLCVNGRTHDTWTYLHELPAPIRDRLLASDD